MKNISLLFAFLFFLMPFVNAQNIQMSKPDSLREAGKLSEAIDEYRNIYRSTPDNRNNTYNFSCAFALTGQKDSAFHYLSIATKNDTSVQSLNDPDFYYLLEDERWAAHEDRLVEKVEAKFGKYENLALSKELWKMKVKDQAFYYHIELADKGMGRKSPVIKALWELKHLINQKNVQRIEEIIAEHGWPKSSVVKGSAAGTVFLVIQHADIEIQKKYLPLMKEAANNNEARWSSLALLIDRVNLREGGKQIYGSQIYRNEDGSFYVKDLEAPEYVNQRRNEVGLGPIQDYVKRWNIEWTIEQKEK